MTKDGDNGYDVTDRISVRHVPVHDYYVITLSGWMKGRVAGLMGTFTGEKYDDLTMPSGETAASEAVRCHV